MIFQIRIGFFLTVAPSFPAFEQCLQLREVFFELFFGHSGHDRVDQFEEPARADLGGYFYVGTAIDGFKLVGGLQFYGAGERFEAIPLVCLEISNFKCALDAPSHEMAKTAE